MVSTEDAVAGRIISTYEKLPPKYKPTKDATGLYNWVPLSGVALVDDEDRIEVVAVATGMKCLPSTLISSLSGIALHDSHAEILALRLFNHFLLSECQKLSRTCTTPEVYDSPFIRRRSPAERSLHSSVPQLFAIRPKWRIYMYCSEAPCGDASMELIMAKQDDATPWTKSAPDNAEVPSPTSSEPEPELELMGRGYFSALGAVRRKPARGDSPPTLSKSCTDKLSLKQCTSLLSSLGSLMIDPASAYLHTLILPASQCVPEACERAFGRTGRMAPVANASWEGGYAYRPFRIQATECEFRYSRGAPKGVNPRAGAGSKPSNVAAAWNPDIAEVIINGVLQGKKKGDVRGASVTSRRRMSELLRRTLEGLKAAEHRIHPTGVGAYTEIKACSNLRHRRKVKEAVIQAALRGWVRNVGDDFKLAEAEGTAISRRTHGADQVDIPQH